jgi:hypothetical protein
MMNVPPASWPILQGPTSITSGESATVRAVFEVPLCYSDDDLRGAQYYNLINATANLQLTLNPNVVTSNPNDNTFACYSGAAGSAGSVTSATVTVYQQLLTQLPTDQNGNVILPTLDIGQLYEVKNIAIGGLTQNQENNAPYTNFRSFYSTFAIFNNNGTNSGRTFGTDMNYWALKAANTIQIFQIDPLLAAQRSREEMMIDLPAGTYYFPSRRQPINTTQVGNMNLILNPSSVNAGGTGYIQVMYEDFGSQNTIANAAALGQ